MMKHKILLWVMVMVLLSSISFGWYSGIAYFPFEGNLNDYGSLGYNILLEGNYTAFPLGILGQSINFTRSITTQGLLNRTMPNVSDVRTVDYWFKLNRTSNNDVVFVFSDISNPLTNRFQIYTGINFPTKISLHYVIDGVIKCSPTNLGSNIEKDTWYHIVVVLGAGVSVYLNDTLVTNCTDSTTIPTGWVLHIGEDYGGTATLDGSVDNFFLTNRQYDLADVVAAYNGGVGLQYNLITTPYFNVSWDTPLAETQFNSTYVEYKYYLVWNDFYAKEDITCTLLQNNTASYAENVTITVSNTTSMFNVSIAPNTQEDWENYFYCQLKVDNTKNTTTATRILHIDNQPPVILTGFSDSTIVYNGLNLVGQFNFSDENLYSYSIDIDGSIHANESNLDNSLFQYNLTYNTTNRTVGLHYLNITVKDGHTDSLIDDWNYSKETDKSIKFNFDDGYISIKPINTLSTDTKFTTSKTTDRYLFDYALGSNELLTNSNKVAFRVTSDYPITIVKKKNYQGHLVIEGLNKWIDFETTSTKSKYVVTRINAFSVDVELQGIVDSKVIFNSIGELNTYQDSFSFYVINATLNYNASDLYGQGYRDFNLTLNITGVPLNVSAMFYYDGIPYTPTTVTTTDYIYYNNTHFLTPLSPTKNVTVGYLLNYNYSSPITNYSNITGNFTLYGINITTGCALANQTINLSLFDENTASTALVGDVEIQGVYWITDKLLNGTFNFTLTGSTQYSLCIYPINSVVKSDFYIKHNTTPLLVNRYYSYNTTLSNTTQFINLYNFNYSTGISELRITIRDSNNYAYLQDVVGRLERFYVGENVWRIVQMGQSDDFGFIDFNIIERMVDYRITFLDLNNNLIKQSTTMKFACYDAVCELVFLLNPSLLTDIEPSLAFTSIYNNDTGMLNLTWVDNSNVITSLRTVVTKETGRTSIIICDTTQTGYSGYVSCNTSTYTGTIQLRSTSTSFEGGLIITAIRYTQLFDASRLKLWQAEGFGVGEGAWWSFGIILTASMFGAIISVFVGIIALIFGSIIVFALGLMQGWTLTLLFGVITLGIIIGVVLRRQK